MGRLEVQGIVAVANDLPYVQFRQLDDNDKVEAQWQATPAEAREMAQQIVEASMNAVYDAALITFARDTWPESESIGPQLVDGIRRYRADTWGLPDRPEDWRTSQEE